MIYSLFYTSDALRGALLITETMFDYSELLKSISQFSTLKHAHVNHLIWLCLLSHPLVFILPLFFKSTFLIIIYMVSDAVALDSQVRIVNSSFHYPCYFLICSAGATYIFLWHSYMNQQKLQCTAATVSR